MLLKSDKPEYTKPYLILGEGQTECNLFYNLLRKHDFADNFNTDYAGGKAQFTRKLNSIRPNEDFITNVKAILLVADNDSDCCQAFADMQRQLRDTGWCGIPNEPLKLVESKENLASIAIMMMPESNKLGNTEQLCLEAAFSKWSDIQGPLAEYIAQVPAGTWDVSPKSVAQMECLLAAVCKEEPEHSLRDILKKNLSDKYVPLDHMCFNRILSYLRTFGDQLQVRVSEERVS